MRRFTTQQSSLTIRGLSATLLMAMSGFGQAALAADVSLDPSQRYYRDTAGNPVFFIGYYGWAAVPPGYTIDHPSQYAAMMQQGAPYKINYIRISLGVNRFTSTTNPPSWNGQPTPVPFVYVGNPAKADLNQWDAVFWNGLKSQCATAQANGVMVHVSIFDGVELRGGGEAYRYANSFWKPSNQTQVFYSDPDTNGNGNIDQGGEFYRLTDFNNNVGLGFYQRRLIEKAVNETAAYPNVFFEVGNELLSSDSAWYGAVVNYMKTLTSKPVTQNDGGAASAAQGWSQHHADTPAQVKSNVASLVGQGRPAWEDPDGPALSDPGVSADDLRRAAWYSFAGGAAGWGGFTVDFWAGGSGFNTTKGSYYRNLQTCIEDSGVAFWQMVPRHDLVGNNAENSCLASVGFEYVVYVLNDASVTLDLNSLSGNATYRLYDPRTAAWSAVQNVAGGGAAIFNKPALADDWVIHIGGGSGPSLDWNTLGPQIEIADGITPGIATDAAGNVHIVYMEGGGIRYRMRDASGTLGAVETILSPEGSGAYNSPHVVCDASGVPHVVFQKDFVGSSFKGWYSNRIGGSWKPPLTALSVDPATKRVNYPRLALTATNAFVGALIDNPDGRLARLSNLSVSPSVDLFVDTTLMSSHPIVDGNNRLWVVGRPGPQGHYIQEYGHNLATIGSARKLNTGTLNKTGEASAACLGAGNVVHAAGIAGATGIDPDSSEMWYNNTQRVDASQPCIRGLTGAPGSDWWGEDVYPDMTADALDRIYIAYRDKITGEGKMTIIASDAFASPVVFAANITNRLRWNAQVAPVPAGGVYVAWDSGGKCYLRTVGASTGSPLTEVSIDLGSPDVAQGMTHVQVGDGDTTPVTIGGRSCRQNVNPAEDFYYYFGVSDSFAFQGSPPDLYIIFEYYDLGGGTISFQYDSSDGVGIPAFYKLGGSVNLTSSNTWKSATFHVTDAYFGNRQNDGADLRLGKVGGSLYIDTVLVTTQAPLPPIIAEVSPDPQGIAPGTPYTQQLTLVQGHPLPTWSLLQGPPGAQVSATGLVSGWTPAPGAYGSYMFEVQATNSEGNDIEMWIAHVPSPKDFDGDGDVDMSDYAVLQRCFSGAAVSYAPGCESTDLDDDGDVDVHDLNLFLPCKAGANKTPDC